MALLAILILAAGAVAAASYFIKPDTARTFDVFSGSVFLEDSVAPVAVDLANGEPTVRLIDANMQVGAKNADDLAVAPLQDGTLLLNRRTGQFNMVDATGFVIKRDGGVPLPKLRGATSATAVPSGELSYIEQTSSTRTSVYLVSRSTVQTALASPDVKPRAFRALRSAVSPDPSASASSDGDLWVLAGTGNQRTIRRLTVPENSEPGATLAADDHGVVSGPAAIGTATDGNDTVVGVASADQIRLFRNGSLTATASFVAPSGLRSIVSATNAEGRLWFLMQAADGWSVVSVATDGSDLRGPTRLTGVNAAAKFVRPAASNGALYTMDADGGQFVRIDSDGHAGGIEGVSRYPLAKQSGKAVEAGGFSDAYVIARGSRVIYNSPGHLDALVLFTDGRRAPLQIEKSAAVAVNAGGGVEALTKSRLGDRSGKRGKTTKPTQQQRSQSPVSNRVDCSAATQKPHIPTIVGATPGSRSVALQWSYPLLDPQDCEPSTYQVSVRTLTNGAPSAPSAVTVQGQTSLNLGGLNPSTEYEITVTAYINGKGTASSPIQVSTGVSGPDEPLGVQANVNSAGLWSISWSSCGTSRSGCVPASSWRVIPQFCDGRGLSTAPSPIDVTADPTTTEQPGAQLDSGIALLGRGLRFQVEGIGDDGTVGTPSDSTGCTYSWSRPSASDISVTASTPPATTADTTTSTTAVVRFPSTVALGGVGAQLSYRLLTATGVTVSTAGPTTSTSAQLGGIRPGGQYHVEVTVIPPQHPEAAIVLPAVAVQPTIANWPAFGVYVRYDTTGLTDAKVSTYFEFPIGTETRGETFDLVNSGMDCGNTHYSLDRSDVTAGQPLSFSFSRLLYNGPCSVTLQLTQNTSTATSPPLFGATSSSAVTSDTFGVDPPKPFTNAGDFTAQWSGTTASPQVLVTYTGPDQLNLATGWTLSVSNGSATCGSSNDPPPTAITVDPACVSEGGTFTVSLDYTYLSTDQPFANILVQGNAPQPVDPTAVTFDASWIGSAGEPAVNVAYTGSADPGSLDALVWDETVVSDGVTCGGATLSPSSGDIQIPVDLSACPPTTSGGTAAIYTVEIHLRDPVYGSTGTYEPQVSGTPPQ